MTDTDSGDGASRHACAAALRWMERRWPGEVVGLTASMVRVARVTDFIASVDVRVAGATLAWVDACALFAVGVYMHYNVAPPLRDAARLEIDASYTALFGRGLMRVQAALMDDGDDDREAPFFSVHVVDAANVRVAAAKVRWLLPG